MRFKGTRPGRLSLTRFALLTGGSVLALSQMAVSQSSGFTVAVPPGENTERAPGSSSGALGAGGFSISIDNEVVAGAPPPPIPQRRER